MQFMMVDWNKKEANEKKSFFLDDLCVLFKLFIFNFLIECKAASEFANETPDRIPNGSQNLLYLIFVDTLEHSSVSFLLLGHVSAFFTQTQNVLTHV